MLNIVFNHKYEGETKGSVELNLPESELVLTRTGIAVLPIQFVMILGLAGLPVITYFHRKFSVK